MTGRSPHRVDEKPTHSKPDIHCLCPAIYLNKLDERGCIGVPDLIIEILSPAAAAKDLKVKRTLYEEHGVQEYRLFHPTDRTVMVYRLDQNGEYAKAEVFTKDDNISSGLFPGLEIELREIFPEI